MNLNPIRSNMTELEIGNKKILFSYKTPVAYFENGQYYITDKFWSRTTTRHINAWVPGDPKLRGHTIGMNVVSQDNLDALIK